MAVASEDPLFDISGLQKWYPVHESLRSRLFGESKYLRAVDGVDLTIDRGEIVGLAGQSGCGKSTLGELIIQLQKPTGGEVRYKGERLQSFDTERMKEFRRECQVIFQDPFESLNPRHTVSRIVTEPLIIHGIGDEEEREARMYEVLSEAGLNPPGEYVDRLPSELSGGQRQRVSIARALVLDPEFIVADEPVSMLDVSVSTGILNTFKDLQANHDISLLYISHDLATIDYLTDRTAIMYLGDIVEVGPTSQVIQSPSHPYTESLISAVPNPDPTKKRGGTDLGDIVDPVNLPSGCRFRTNCPYATEECAEKEPSLEPDERDKLVSCFNPVDD